MEELPNVLASFPVDGPSDRDPYIGVTVIKLSEQRKSPSLPLKFVYDQSSSKVPSICSEDCADNV